MLRRFDVRTFALILPMEDLSPLKRRGLVLIREAKDLDWTYISPAADFQPDSPATGRYVVAGEEFTTNEKGESFISYADYASALLDELESHAHPTQRISVYTAS